MARPLVLIAAVLTPTLAWIAIDRSIWSWDPSWYGWRSIELWVTLRHETGSWPSAMEHVQHVKAPGIAWLGQFFVPLAGATGNVHVALLLSVVAAQAMALGLVYAAGLRLADGRRAVATVALLAAAASPLFVALGRMYLVESLQTAAVAWVVFAAASASRWRPALTIAHLVAALSLGLLAKAATPLYMAAPGAAALAIAASRATRSPRDRRSRDIRLLATVGLAAALALVTGAWYASNGGAVIRLARRSGGNRLYGNRDALYAELWSNVQALERALFLPRFSLLLIPLVLIAAGISLRRRLSLTRAILRSPAVLCYASCLAAIGVVLITLSLQVNDDIRFLCPLVAPAAVLLAGAVNLVGSRLAPALAIVALGCQFALVTVESFSHVHFGALDGYLTIRRPAHPAFSHELRRLANLTCDEQAEGRTTVVGADYAWLNADTLAMVAAQHFLPARGCRYGSLGDAEDDARPVWRRIQQARPPYYVSIDYGNAGNPLPPALAAQLADGIPFNRVNRAVFERVAHSARFTAIPASKRSGVVVFRSCFRPIGPFVRHFVRVVLRRPAHAEELARWSADLARARARGLDSAVAAAGRLATSIFESREYARLRTSDRRYVADLYASFLERRPDPAGGEGWLRELRSGWSREAVREAFAAGEEFREHTHLFCTGHGR